MAAFMAAQVTEAAKQARFETTISANPFRRPSLNTLFNTKRRFFSHSQMLDSRELSRNLRGIGEE